MTIRPLFGEYYLLIPHPLAPQGTTQLPPLGHFNLNSNCCLMGTPGIIFGWCMYNMGQLERKNNLEIEGMAFSTKLDADTCSFSMFTSPKLVYLSNVYR